MSQRHHFPPKSHWFRNRPDSRNGACGKRRSVTAPLQRSAGVVKRASSKPTVRARIVKSSADSVSVSGIRQSTHSLNAGQAVEVSVGFVEPSKLPVNGRIAVEWKLADSDGALARVGGRKADDFGIYTLPGELAEDASRSRSGRIPHLSRPHRGKVRPYSHAGGEGSAGWRWGALARKGEAPEMFPVPTSTPWPKGAAAQCA